MGEMNDFDEVYLEDDEGNYYDPLDRPAKIHELCGWCGKPARGWAYINNQRYCHPDFSTGRTCYQEASWAMSKNPIETLLDSSLTKDNDGQIPDVGRWGERLR